MYVFVVVNPLNVYEPLSATEPISEREAEVAFVEVHDTVELPPDCTELGLAVMVQNGVCVCGCTFTTVEQVLVPPLPETVRMYVLVVVRPLKVYEPFNATEPTSVSDAEVAFVELHVSVVLPPEVTEVGLAVRVHDGVCV